MVVVLAVTNLNYNHIAQHWWCGGDGNNKDDCGGVREVNINIGGICVEGNRELMIGNLDDDGRNKANPKEISQ